MKSKIMIGALVAVAALAGFLFYQNMKLAEELEDLKKVAIIPSPPPVMPDAVSTPSPFDNPQTDPAAVPSPVAQGPLTSIQFDKMSHNFGKIKEGEKVKTVFKFTNTGTNPLIISSATGSCGCTVPEWPRNPIAPGESGKIDVEFDSGGKSGENDKSVTVIANTEPSTIVLSVKSTIIPRDK